MLVAPYPNAASSGVYCTLNAVIRGWTYQKIVAINKPEETYNLALNGIVLEQLQP